MGQGYGLGGGAVTSVMATSVSGAGDEGAAVGAQGVPMAVGMVVRRES